MRKAIIIILILGLIGGVAVYITVFGIKPKSSNTFSASGAIEATELNIGTQVGGMLEKIAIKEGDKIEKGDLIAKTDDVILKSQLEQAEAGLAAAEANLEHTSDASGTQRSVAEAETQQAQANVDIAKTQLGFSSVKSPIDGDVLSVPFNKGENISPGAILAVLADLEHLKVIVYVPESRLGAVKIGSQVKMKVDSYGSRVFKGKVVAIADEPEFTPTNIETKEQRVKQVYAVTISIGNQDERLKPGMSVTVDFKMNANG